MLSLDQVMAEQGVVGKTIADGAVKRLQIVEALAREAALAEQVLIDVRDRSRVRIDADRAALQAGETGALGRDHTDPDSRLQHRIPLRDRVGARVDRSAGSTDVRRSQSGCARRRAAAGCPCRA